MDELNIENACISLSLLLLHISNKGKKKKKKKIISQNIITLNKKPNPKYKKNNFYNNKTHRMKSYPLIKKPNII